MFRLACQVTSKPDRSCCQQQIVLGFFEDSQWCQLIPQLPPAAWLQAKSSDLSMVASKTPGLVGGFCFELTTGYLIRF